VLLNQGFTAEGLVDFDGSDIGGDLDCEGAEFTNPSEKRASESGTALTAIGVRVKGSVYLKTSLGKGSAPFKAIGAVRLTGAQIDGQLDCSGGTFTNPRSTAFSAERIVVKSSVFMRDRFTSHGGVLFPSAQIGTDLDCTAAVLNNPAEADALES